MLLRCRWAILAHSNLPPALALTHAVTHRRGAGAVRNPTRTVGPRLALSLPEDKNVADGMYVGMAAAAARAEQLDSIADNLANAETPGYKATRPAFQSFLPAYKGPGLVDKVFSAIVSTGTDMSPGPVGTNDNPLRLRPSGETFL